MISKILLKDDIKKLSDLNFSLIKSLISYYQITDISKNNNDQLINFSVTFDKEKIHDLFYKRSISYSKISDKELFIIPIFLKENEIFIFNNNFFYENWNKNEDENLIEFILPLENIEIIQKINKNKNNLIDLNINSLFQEYQNKNLALIIIENNKQNYTKVYFKTKIQGKIISKNLNFKMQNLESDKSFEKIITESKKELVNILKSENLIDIRTPSFLKVKLGINKNSNLVLFNSKMKNIDLIEKVYVQEFNKDYMNLRLKYLGKIENIINQLKNADIDLQFINEQWTIKSL